MSLLLIEVDEFESLQGQEPGRELELEITAVVTKVVERWDGDLLAEGGSPSPYVVLTPVRVDIVQTT